MFLILHSTLSDINIIFIALIFNTKRHLLIFRRNICIILIRYIFYKQNWNVLCFLLFLIYSEPFFLIGSLTHLQVLLELMCLFLVIFLFSAFVLSCSLCVLYSVLFEIHFSPFILYSFCEMNISCFYSSWYLHVDFPEMFLTCVTLIIQAKQNAFSCAPIWDENYRSHRPPTNLILPQHSEALSKSHFELIIQDYVYCDICTLSWLNCLIYCNSAALSL